MDVDAVRKTVDLYSWSILFLSEFQDYTLVESRDKVEMRSLLLTLVCSMSIGIVVEELRGTIGWETGFPMGFSVGFP